MDTSWWNRRTVTDGKVVESNSRSMLARRMWIRWRLVDDFLKRFYLDYGLEPLFGHMGVEWYQVGLWSPHCRRAPRYFGRLCFDRLGHFHNADDSDLLPPTAVKVNPASLRPERDLEAAARRRVWPSWSAYLQDAISALGLAEGGVSGHENCFHRRGKSLLACMYRVAVLLRTSGSAWSQVRQETDRRLLISYPPVGADFGEQGMTAEILSVLEVSGAPLDPPVASYFVVRRADSRWIALRTDGWIATPSGPMDAAAAWRGGTNEDQLARLVTRRIQGNV